MSTAQHENPGPHGGEVVSLWDQYDDPIAATMARLARQVLASDSYSIGRARSRAGLPGLTQLAQEEKEARKAAAEARKAVQVARGRLFAARLPQATSPEELADQLLFLSEGEVVLQETLRRRGAWSARQAAFALATANTYGLPVSAQALPPLYGLADLDREPGKLALLKPYLGQLRVRR